MVVNKIKNILSFSSFTEQKARRILGLKQEIELNLIVNWEERAKKMSITEEEQKIIQKLQDKLKVYARAWNEEELKTKFIAPLVELVNFDHYKLEIASFLERSLEIITRETQIKGNVDWMVATGISEPENPFFFIHEYKKEQNTSGDAVGQLLATMFTAQELNKKPRSFSLFKTEARTFEHIPIYGVYVIGRFWFFVRLEGQKYYISKAYDSLEDEDLKQIVLMLKAQREMIISLVTEK